MDPQDSKEPPCNCPDRTKDGSILYNLLASSPDSPDTVQHTTERCPMVHMVNNVWRRSCPTNNSATNATASSSTSPPYPPSLVILRHAEDTYQQAAQLLLKTVDFVRNLPAMQRLCTHDRVTLLQHCWAELLVLTMTQYRFEFETEELTLLSSSSHDDQNPCSCSHGNAESMLVKCLVALQGIPTKSDVHMINSFFTKCDLLQLEDKEYAYLKATILFNPDIPGLINPGLVESLQSEAQLSLNEYVAAMHPADPLRFARVLLSLPPLRNIRSRVVSQLFFRELIGDVSMEDLLKQMLLLH
ncbi:nuclear receptor subfamily 0 group B member 2-like [Amphiura filiformis]|uniref:nuclear receptor subfamily 0 group B member 2-like n=1 Tax=Amphiura filiformis TaxID=82378 RepID=UPI003B21DB72